MKHKAFYTLLITALLFTTAAVRAQPNAAETFSFDIPSQSMSKALLEFGEVTNRAVTADSRDIEGVVSNALSGRMTAQEAIQVITRETGVVVETINDVDFLVRKNRNNSANYETLDEIIVTGQKRNLSLQEVSDSVAVWTPTQVEDLTFTSLTDLYQATPNVNAVSDTEGEFSIRGINYRGVGGIGVANAGSLYIDDAYQSNLGVEAGASGLWDIQQVEIFRGPQSTIQGRNSIAGSIVVRTVDPTYEWDVRARAEYAEFDTRRVSGAVGGPAIDDVLAFRLSADQLKTDGFVENTFIGVDDVADDDALTARAKILFEPTERLSALVTYVHTEGNAGTGLGTGAVEGPGFEQREVTTDNQTLQEIETDTLSLRLGYEVNEHIELQLISVFFDADETSKPRYPVNPGGIVDIGFDEEEIDSHELRALYKNGPWDLAVGLYYFDQDQNFGRDLSAPIFNFFLTTTGTNEIRNTAVYFDGEYRVSDQLAVLFGGRFDREEFSVSSTTNGVTLDADTEFDLFMPKAGFRYRYNDQQTFGASVQQAYRGGGAGLTSSGNPFEYDEETLWSYEVFYRSLWLNGDLSINASVFYMDWTDQQIGVGTFPDSFIDNAGESTLTGLEIDFSWAATNNLTVFGGIGILDTEFKDAGAMSPVEGNEFAQAPGFQLSFGTIYEHPRGFFGSFDGTYIDESFSDTTNMIENELDNYALFNMKLGYRTSQWTAALFARNLFDEDYAFAINVFDFRGGPGGLATLGDPRVIGAEVSFDL